MKNKFILIIFLFISIAGLYAQEKDSNFTETKLTQNDKNWIKDYVEIANKMGKETRSDFRKNNFTPELLDQIFVKCLPEIEIGNLDSQFVSETLGIAFGTYLIETLNGSWILVTDEKGTDLAVKLKNNQYAFPISTVSKRISTKETGFFASIFEFLSK
jgi:Domain of unknown function (DUF3806)